MKNIRIAIYGWFGAGNLGDDLLEQATYMLLKNFEESMDVKLLVDFVQRRTKNRVKTEKENYREITLKEYFKSKYDILLIGPGGLIPQSNFRKLGLLYCIIRNSKKHIFWGIGINPITNYKKAYQRIFLNSNGLILRDIESVKNSGNNKALECIDLVIACRHLLFKSLLKSGCAEGDIYKAKTTKLYINCRGSSNNSENARFYIEIIKKVKHEGYDVILVAFHDLDLELCNMITKNYKLKVKSVDVDNVEGFFNGVEADAPFLCERYHGMILALLFRKKLVPIIYDYKHIYLLNLLDWKAPRFFHSTDKKAYLRKEIESNTLEILDYINAVSSIDYGDYYQKIDYKAEQAFKVYFSVLAELVCDKND